jgi:uncharacterized oligopeptide transporter (OPT) family protein
MTGGILGVLFTIPLRMALVVKQKLKFPEGIATAEVLKTGVFNPFRIVLSEFLIKFHKLGDSDLRRTNFTYVR